MLPEKEGVHGGEERLLVHPGIPGNKIKSIIYKKITRFDLKNLLLELVLALKRLHYNVPKCEITNMYF